MYLEEVFGLNYLRHLFTCFGLNYLRHHRLGELGHHFKCLSLDSLVSVLLLPLCLKEGSLRLVLELALAGPRGCLLLDLGFQLCNLLRQALVALTALAQLDHMVLLVQLELFIAFWLGLCSFLFIVFGCSLCHGWLL